jgi:hypothetical protein
MSFRLCVGLLLLPLLFAGGTALLRGGVYGWTIFVVFPMILGGLASWVVGPATAGRAAGVGVLAPTAVSFLLLLLGKEGLICILMCLPLTVPLGALGGWMVHVARASRPATWQAGMLLLLSPTAFLWDVKAPPGQFAAHSAITVAATPDKVWKHVVAFSDLPEPQEWFFRAGVAYPKRARIEGSGPGATRYCEFSTGPFVEPIEVWDQPRLLRFHVTENPAPMREWSPYAQVLPRHLHGYLVARRGQFRLTPLAGGRTLLEGTTWYQHGLWPAEYWRWWSDAIIHRIHLRVLHHIRALAEQEPG